jgi:hypothetical protein
MRTDRQGYALAHPLARADLGMDLMAPHTRDRRHATGLYVRTILAVDR